MQSAPTRLTVPVSLMLALAAAAQVDVPIPRLHELTLGNAVRNAGDVDGDGVNDIVLGNRADGTNGPDMGAVMVYSGADGTLIHRILGDPVPGGELPTLLGTAVGGVGDIDGDGRPDFAAATDNLFTPELFFYSGRDGATLGVAPAHVNRIEPFADLDGDGRDDFIAGGTTSVDVVSGATGAILLHVATATSFPFDTIGFAVNAGDVDGDGLPDVLAGVSALVGPGRVDLVSGADGSVLRTVAGPQDGNQFGATGTVPGDLDGDGIDDWVIGAPFERIGGMVFGAVRGYSGATGALLFTAIGETPSGGFGAELRPAGDANGDGVPDVIMAHQGFYVIDEVRVLSGVDGTTLARLRDEFRDTETRSVDGLGDLDGDGFPELAIAHGLDRPAEVLTLCGAAAFGAPSGAGTLVLAWRPGAAPPIGAGSVSIEGAVPFSSGLILVGAGQGTSSAGGLDILVDLTPGTFFGALFGYDARGQRTIPADLRGFAAAGLLLYSQAFAADPSGAASASNGLAFALCP